MKTVLKFLLFLIIFQVLNFATLAYGFLNDLSSSYTIKAFLSIFLLTSLSLMVLCCYRRQVRRLSEGVLLVLLAANIALVMSLFGPIFIDRSISYHMLMALSEGIPASRLDFSKGCNFSTQKRLFELKHLGLLEFDKKEGIASTEQGRFLARIWRSEGNLTNSLDAYHEYLKIIRTDNGK